MYIWFISLYIHIIYTRSFSWARDRVRYIHVCTHGLKCTHPYMDTHSYNQRNPRTQTSSWALYAHIYIRNLNAHIFQRIPLHTRRGILTRTCSCACHRVRYLHVCTYVITPTRFYTDVQSYKHRGLPVHELAGGPIIMCAMYIYTLNSHTSILIHTHTNTEEFQYTNFQLGPSSCAPASVMSSLNMIQCLPDNVSTRISLMDGMCLYGRVSSLYVCVWYGDVIYMCVRERARAAIWFSAVLPMSARVPRWWMVCVCMCVCHLCMSSLFIITSWWYMCVWERARVSTWVSAFPTVSARVSRSWMVCACMCVCHRCMCVCVIWLYDIYERERERARIATWVSAFLIMSARVSRWWIVCVCMGVCRLCMCVYDMVMWYMCVCERARVSTWFTAFLIMPANVSRSWMVCVCVYACDWHI